MYEDIDCMKTGKARPETDESTKFQLPIEKPDVADRFGVTLSGLLNVLDGFNAPESVLFIMTTNKIETLDPALLRPGRIDYRLYLGTATEDQKIELFLRFFPRASILEARQFVKKHRSAETMAEFQGLLLGLEQHCSSPETARLLQDA
jgi:chaperone BCS1